MEEFFKTFGGAVGILAGMLWITQQFINYRFQRDLKQKTVEHEVRFRGMYDRAAAGMAAVFVAVSRLQQALELFAVAREHHAPPENVKSSGEQLSKAEKRCREAFTKYRLFLPVELYRQLKNYEDKAFHASLKCIHAAAPDRTKNIDDDIKDWQGVNDLIRKELANDIAVIHDDFQRFLARGEVSAESSPPRWFSRARPKAR